MPPRPQPKLSAALVWTAACCARPVAAGGGGGNGVWWSYEFEYFHFECYVVIILVVLALLVDTLHHRLSHMARGARAWRGDTATAHREVHRASQVPLWESIFSNSVGELMVLGCVAVVVWTGSRAGLFDIIAISLKDYSVIALPGESSDYLHLVEDVHMQLFGTMMLYIGVMALTVRGTTRAERLWEAADDRLAVACDDASNPTTSSTHVPEAVLEEFDRTRKEFLSSIEDWRGRWQMLDIHIEPVLRRLPENRAQVFTPVLSTEAPSDVVIGNDFGSNRMPVIDLLGDWFPFDEYLALECRFLVQNMAEVKPLTWVFIMFSMLVKAQLLRETQSSAASYGFDALIMLALVIFVGASGWQIRQSYRMQRQRQEVGSSSAKQSIERHRTMRMSKQASKIWKKKLNEVRSTADAHISYPWLTAINLLQIMLFYIMFDIVRFATLRQWWEKELVRSLVCSLLVLLVAPLLGVGLGRAIPRLSSLLALADFMQERHLQWLRVILEDHASGRDHFNNNRRLSLIVMRGLSSMHFEAPPGSLHQQLSYCSTSSDASKGTVGCLDPATILAARRAAAQERRESSVAGRQSSEDLPGVVNSLH